MNAFVRRWAEALLRPLVLRRRMPASAGRGWLVVSAKVGGLKYLLKPAERWDPELVRIASRLVSEGDIVWDVGANVGLFSKAASERAGPRGHVVALEADDDAATLLLRTAQLASSRCAPMTVVPTAVGRRCGFASFAIARRARASNALEGYGSTQTGGTREVRRVASTSLDALIDRFGAPDVVKIDVEGAEMEVLEGASRLLVEVRPAIYCEVCSATRSAVSRLLHAHSYAMWDGADFDQAEGLGIALAAGNTVAIPLEKRARYCTRAGEGSPA
ncbi:FkbM family methyltransferase [Dokdonella sp.]|uniref:FkbM family methyltransferase n=1 Tax=Dokdonella sp. TaxID=2291710 RepID=UPI002F42631F